MTPPWAPSYRASLMKIKTTSTLVATALAASCLLPGNADAAMIINIEEVGSDVVASYSGSWDSWTKTGDAVSSSKYIAAPSAFHNLQGGQDQMSESPMTLTLGTWTDTFTAASSFTGDPFGFTANVGSLWAPVGYVAGESLSGSLIFNGTDVVTMGFTPGEIGVFSGGGNTVNYSVSGPAAVPEPGTWAAAALLAAGAAFARWRRRQSAAG